MDTNEAFLGRGWSFPPQFSTPASGPLMVAGEEDIRQSLQILLGTTLTERTMFSGYGSDIFRYAFEESGQGLTNSIRNSVADAILRNEARIRMDDLSVNASSEAGMLEICITYTVLATNSRSNLVFPFYLNEATL
jgi:uncharacterized protein